MSNINKKLFKRLHLNHAYGQLIALIFVPIMVLACVGAALVLTETSDAAKAQQRQMAIAILTRFQTQAEQAITLLNYYPLHYDHGRTFMQTMMNNKHVIRTAILDDKGVNRLSLGDQAQAPWPKPNPNTSFLGPIEHQNSHIYGMAIHQSPNKTAWLMVELDNQPLQIARYRVLIVLVATGDRKSVV